MKKFISIFISIVAALSVFAQPVITSDINLSLGDTYRLDGYTGGIINGDPGPPGANQIWNFANVTGDVALTGNTYFCVDPSATPFADSSAVQDADISTVFYTSDGDASYFYYINSTSSQVLTASGDTTPDGNFGYGDIIDGFVQYKFPFTYNDSYDFSYEVMHFGSTQGYYFHRDSSTVTVEADAYGTITTPVDTYQNTLRIKTTHHEYNWMKFNPGDDWMFIGDAIFIYYTWMAPGIKVPVMIVTTGEDSEVYSVNYLVEYNFTMGIEEQPDCRIELYPNPVTDRLTIQSDKPFTSIRLSSINGQLMKAAALQTNRLTIDFSKYPKGIYLAEIEFNDGSHLTKKIIK